MSTYYREIYATDNWWYVLAIVVMIILLWSFGKGEDDE